MDLDAYFQRIGYTGEAGASLAVLQHIHRLHPQAIPFENLSAFLVQEVSLDPARVFNKLVVQGRGGYCFEQNLLLANILRELGFVVSAHAARVLWRSPDKTEVARTHKLLRVEVGGESWIADVGFGGLTMTAPLKLEPDLEQSSPHETFRITREGDEYTLAVKLRGAWRPMYVFDLVPQYPPDFEMANHYVASHPQSLFVHNLMLGAVEADCRHAMQNRHYSRYSTAGDREEKVISDFGHLTDLLTNTFGINLDAGVDQDALAEKFEKLD